MIPRLVSAVALALAAVFLGIALYINLAEQPARLALADSPLLAQWKVSFGIGFILQGSLAIVSGLFGLAAWKACRDWRWGAGGLLMLANWPWTLIIIAPLNAALLGTTADAAGAESRALIEQWGTAHSGRTAISFAAVGVYLWAMARSGIARSG